MVKNMLNVLMDGIKDAEMVIEYAYQAYDDENMELMNWFADHAKKRYDTLVTDFAFVNNKLGMTEKIRSGDAIAEALHSHIDCQIKKVREALSDIGK